MNFLLTFTGKSSFGLKNKLQKLMKESCIQLDVRIILKPENTIQHFFNFKDKFPAELQSLLAYKCVSLLLCNVLRENKALVVSANLRTPWQICQDKPADKQTTIIQCHSRTYREHLPSYAGRIFFSFSMQVERGGAKYSQVSLHNERQTKPMR